MTAAEQNYARAQELATQFANIVSIKFNSYIHPFTIQITKSLTDENEASIGGMELEGLAELTDAYCKNVESLLLNNAKNLERNLNNQIIN
jgi:hypothetical protein